MTDCKHVGNGNRSEYKSPLKVAGGGEGNRCKYNVRLDTYGCGCQHDCSYCYAKSLLQFRGLWDARVPRVANVDRLRKAVGKLEEGSVVRLGGMTDCFMPLEKECGVTLETLKMLNERGIGYLIVTKSPLVAEKEYVRALDPELAHIQVSVTSLDDGLAKTYEPGAAEPSRRIRAAKNLQRAGYDVQLRLSPYLGEWFINPSILALAGIKKGVVEFLRVNHWVKQWFCLDYSAYTVKSGGYEHLPLEAKIQKVEALRPAFERLTVCEDEPEAYQYWREHVNPNKDDCCDLRPSGVCA